MMLSGLGLELTAFVIVAVAASLRRRARPDPVAIARWAPAAAWRLELESGATANARLEAAVPFPPGWLVLRWRDGRGGPHRMVVQCSEAPSDCRRLVVRLRLDPAFQGDSGCRSA